MVMETTIKANRFSQLVREEDLFDVERLHSRPAEGVSKTPYDTTLLSWGKWCDTVGLRGTDQALQTNVSWEMNPRLLRYVLSESI